MAKQSDSEKKLMGDILEEWQKQNKAYSFEGCSGVRKLETLLKQMGYNDGQFIGDHPILNFLADNSGAIEALLEWIKEVEVEEWKESLSEYLEGR